MENNTAFIEEFATRLQDPENKKVLLQIIDVHDKYELAVKEKTLRTKMPHKKIDWKTAAHALKDRPGLDEDGKVFKQYLEKIAAITAKTAEKSVESAKGLDLSPIPNPFGEESNDKDLDTIFDEVDAYIKQKKESNTFFSKLKNLFRK